MRLIPALKRWAIFIRPLRGLVLGVLTWTQCVQVQRNRIRREVCLLRTPREDSSYGKQAGSLVVANGLAVTISCEQPDRTTVNLDNDRPARSASAGHRGLHWINSGGTDLVWENVGPPEM